MRYVTCGTMRLVVICITWMERPGCGFNSGPKTCHVGPNGAPSAQMGDTGGQRPRESLREILARVPAPPQQGSEEPESRLAQLPAPPAPAPPPSRGPRVLPPPPPPPSKRYWESVDEETPRTLKRPKARFDEWAKCDCQCRRTWSQSYCIWNKCNRPLNFGTAASAEGEPWACMTCGERVCEECIWQDGDAERESAGSKWICCACRRHYD